MICVTPRFIFVEMGKDECSPEINAGLTKAAGFIRESWASGCSCVAYRSLLLSMTNLLVIR